MRFQDAAAYLAVGLRILRDYRQERQHDYDAFLSVFFRVLRGESQQCERFSGAGGRGQREQPRRGLGGFTAGFVDLVSHCVHAAVGSRSADDITAVFREGIEYFLRVERLVLGAGYDFLIGVRSRSEVVRVAQAGKQHSRVEHSGKTGIIRGDIRHYERRFSGDKTVLFQVRGGGAELFRAVH